jgi:uncharacterized membrane protein YphA (DoxX/SURF4 family)
MSNNQTIYTIALVIILVLAGVQGFLLYRIVQLDTSDQYSDIPQFIGFNVLLYAAILFIYLRIFIGVKAYKVISDEH